MWRLFTGSSLKVCFTSFVYIHCHLIKLWMVFIHTYFTFVLFFFSGGDAKLLILLCVAPAQRYITESLQCLGFGARARQVQRGQTKRRLPSSAEKVSVDSTRSSRSVSVTGPPPFSQRWIEEWHTQWLSLVVRNILCPNLLWM